MIRRLLMLVVIVALALGANLRAQDKEVKQDKPAPPPAKPVAVIPLKVQIVLARYQGEKKTSSLPFTLWVNTNDRARTSLRMGAKIPVAVATPSVSVSGSFTYQDVGTNIDCAGSTLDDGRFRLDLTIEDSSIYDESQGTRSPSAAGEHPSFRSFRSVNTLVLRDGQSVQYTTATDRVNGEVVKVDVTVNALK